MEVLSYRVIRNEPGRLQDSLSKEGIVLITKGGEPFALMVGLIGESFVDTLRLVTQLRAQQAVASMRAQAQQRGLDWLTEEQIQAEIDTVRLVR